MRRGAKRVGRAAHRVASGLVGGIVPNLEVRVVKRLLAAHALRGIEAQHLRKQVNRERVRLGEERRKGHTGFNREGPNIVLGLIIRAQFRTYAHIQRRTHARGPYAAERVLRGCSEVVQDLIELVDVAKAWN